MGKLNVRQPDSDNSPEAIKMKVEELGSTLILVEPDGVRSYVTCSCTTCRSNIRTRYERIKNRPAGSGIRCPRCRIPRGPASPYFSPTSARTARHQKTPEVQTWYLEVLKAAKFKCVISGAQAKTAHHLYSYGAYQDLRLDLRNGVALAQPLHKEFHDLYGYGANTLQQFQDFFLKKTNGVFEDPFAGTSIALVEAPSRQLVNEARAKERCSLNGVEFLAFNVLKDSSYKYRVSFRCPCGKEVVNKAFWQMTSPEKCRCLSCLSKLGRARKLSNSTNTPLELSK